MRACDEHQPGDDPMPVGVEAEQVDAVVEHADDQDAGDGSGEPASACVRQMTGSGAGTRGAAIG
jgi:hypothetical protein